MCVFFNAINICNINWWVNRIESDKWKRLNDCEGCTNSVCRLSRLKCYCANAITIPHWLLFYYCIALYINAHIIHLLDIIIVILAANTKWQQQEENITRATLLWAVRLLFCYAVVWCYMGANVRSSELVQIKIIFAFVTFLYKL